MAIPLFPVVFSNQLLRQSHTPLCVQCRLVYECRVVISNSSPPPKKSRVSCKCQCLVIYFHTCALTSRPTVGNCCTAGLLRIIKTLHLHSRFDPNGSQSTLKMSLNCKTIGISLLNTQVYLWDETTGGLKAHTTAIQQFKTKSKEYCI